MFSTYIDNTLLITASSKTELFVAIICCRKKSRAPVSEKYAYDFSPTSYYLVEVT